MHSRFFASPERASRRAPRWAAVAVFVRRGARRRVALARAARIRGNRFLGPDSGELVADYLARADASIADAEREPAPGVGA